MAPGYGWSFYTEPVYPFPEPYGAPPVIAPVAPAPSNPAVWYYCANPPGYYPQVQQCFTGWQPVPSG